MGHWQCNICGRNKNDELPMGQGCWHAGDQEERHYDNCCKNVTHSKRIAVQPPCLTNQKLNSHDIYDKY